MKRNYLIAGLMITSVIVSLVNPAQARWKLEGQGVDDMADWMFNRLHSELGGRKLRRDESDYIKDWLAIREALDNEMVYEVRQCFSDAPQWYLRNYDFYPDRYVSPSLDRIADAIFYSRYPEWRGRQLPRDNRNEAHEKINIRRAISSIDPCD